MTPSNKLKYTMEIVTPIIKIKMLLMLSSCGKAEGGGGGGGCCSRVRVLLGTVQSIVTKVFKKIKIKMLLMCLIYILTIVMYTCLLC